MVERLLMIEDDARLAQMVSQYLGQSGYQVTHAADAHSGLERLQSRGSEPLPDLVILDLMLPDMDGLEVCKRIRAMPGALARLPVLMLTAKGDPMDRIVGLEIGADDYLPKPFEPRELLARIRSVLRRTRALPPNLEAPEAKRMRFGGWTLELDTRQLVSPDAVVVALSGAEFRLLKVFLDHPNRVLSRDQLLNLTRGREAEPFDRSVDLLVSRVRQKLDEDARSPRIIKTVRSEGYVLSLPVTVER